jgi:hypothetical protein
MHELSYAQYHPPVLNPDYDTPCMGALNRLEWGHGITETAFGMDYAIRSNDRGLMEEIIRRDRLMSRPSRATTVDRVFSIIKGGRKGSRRYYNLLYCNHALAARSFELEDVLARLDELVRLSIAELSRDMVFLHAGAVEWKGRVILLPGQSFSGKSTLVSELIGAGATYYSDEYALVDQDGWISPHDKPLQIRNTTGENQLVELPGFTKEIPGRKRLPVSLVVSTRYRQGAKWKPRRLTTGQGVLTLFESAFAARHSPDTVLTFLHNLLLGAEAIRSPRDEARSVVLKILNRAERVPA